MFDESQDLLLQNVSILHKKKGVDNFDFFHTKQMTRIEYNQKRSWSIWVLAVKKANDLCISSFQGLKNRIIAWYHCNVKKSCI